MTTWTQTHPTQPVTTPGGENVEIDVEMVDLVTQLWRCGFETSLACQDLGEAILGGGTRVPPEERERRGPARRGRAWLKVRPQDATRLLELVFPLNDGGAWKVHTEEACSRDWVAITFPRRQILEAAELLKQLPGVKP